MTVGLKGAFDCIKAFSETDQTEDLKKFDRPTLIIHGDDDQIVPIADSALLSSKIVKGATLKIYPGAPHGLTFTHKEQFNADLLAFLRSLKGTYDSSLLPGSFHSRKCRATRQQLMSIKLPAPQDTDQRFPSVICYGVAFKCKL